MNVIKIRYDWFEGEYRECYVGKEASFEEIEKDLLLAKDYAQKQIGTDGEFRVDCLPTYYDDVLHYLTTHGYTYINIDNDVQYYVDDSDDVKNVLIGKLETNYKRTHLGE